MHRINKQLAYIEGLITYNDSTVLSYFLRILRWFTRAQMKVLVFRIDSRRKLVQVNAWKLLPVVSLCEEVRKSKGIKRKSKEVLEIRNHTKISVKTHCFTFCLSYHSVGNHSISFRVYKSILCSLFFFWLVALFTWQNCVGEFQAKRREIKTWSNWRSQRRPIIISSRFRFWMDVNPVDLVSEMDDMRLCHYIGRTKFRHLRLFR